MQIKRHRKLIIDLSIAKKKKKLIHELARIQHSLKNTASFDRVLEQIYRNRDFEGHPSKE